MNNVQTISHKGIIWEFNRNSVNKDEKWNPFFPKWWQVWAKKFENWMTSTGLNPKPYLKHKPRANRALCWAIIKMTRTEPYPKQWIDMKWACRESSLPVTEVMMQVQVSTTALLSKLIVWEQVAVDQFLTWQLHNEDLYESHLLEFSHVK